MPHVVPFFVTYAVMWALLFAVVFGLASSLSARVRRRRVLTYLRQAAMYLRAVDDQLDDRLQWGIDGKRQRALKAPDALSGKLARARVKAVADCIDEAKDLNRRFRVGGTVPGIGTAVRCPADWVDCLSGIKRRFARSCLDVRGPCFWFLFWISARDIKRAIAPLRAPERGSNASVLHSP